MQFKREHIIYKILAFTLAWAILIPTAVKFTHAFNHYKHEVCLGEKTTHLHKLDLNCKFYDFKLTQNFLVSHFQFNAFIPKKLHLKIASQYIFLSSYQQLHFSLRGPPTLV
jgi:hypothetical protein